MSELREVLFHVQSFALGFNLGFLLRSMGRGVRRAFLAAFWTSGVDITHLDIVSLWLLLVLETANLVHKRTVLLSFDESLSFL